MAGGLNAAYHEVMRLYLISRPFICANIEWEVLLSNVQLLSYAAQDTQNAIGMALNSKAWLSTQEFRIANLPEEF